MTQLLHKLHCCAMLEKMKCIMLILHGLRLLILSDKFREEFKFTNFSIIQHYKIFFFIILLFAIYFADNETPASLKAIDVTHKLEALR